MSGEQGDLDGQFRALIGKYQPALRRIARVYAGWRGEEDDLYQDIVLQIWRGIGRFRGDSAPGTWLYRVALNTALSYGRGATRRSRVEVVGVDPSRHPTSVGAPREQSAILAEFLDSLSEVERTVMVLFMEGLSHGEIGEVIGSSPGAIAVRVHRLRRTFVTRYVGD